MSVKDALAYYYSIMVLVKSDYESSLEVLEATWFCKGLFEFAVLKYVIFKIAI